MGLKEAFNEFNCSERYYSLFSEGFIFYIVFKAYDIVKDSFVLSK